jgi:DNA primase
MTVTDIRSLAEQYLSRVRQTGSENIMAVCPFHSRADGTPERSPSFAMSLTTGLYMCHSCGTKGNLRMFLKNMNVSPVLIDQMYRFILEEAESHTTPPPDPLRARVVSDRPINEQLLGLFNYAPTDLLRVGFTEKTLQTFEIGYDTWHSRTTYPIRDLKGQLVGISGRATYDDQIPRYKIYDKEYIVWEQPVREGWDKRTVLYNAYRVYPACFLAPTPPPVVVVEGFKACAWVHQAGEENVTGLMGSYMSWEHRWILERIGAPVRLWLDNNDAGWSGAYKAANILSRSLRVQIVEYPDRLKDDDKAQPSDCTPEEILFQLEHAVDWHAFLYNR